jgi:hypothetical protein
MAWSVLLAMNVLIFGFENEKAALGPRRLFVWKIGGGLDQHKYHYA